MSAFSWALAARDASAALARPAEPTPKKLRLDSPSAPSLRSCGSGARSALSISGVMGVSVLIIHPTFPECFSGADLFLGCANDQQWPWGNCVASPPANNTLLINGIPLSHVEFAPSS